MARAKSRIFVEQTRWSSSNPFLSQASMKTKMLGGALSKVIFPRVCCSHTSTENVYPWDGGQLIRTFFSKSQKGVRWLKIVGKLLITWL
jgi:hypothetical protein